MASVVHGKRKIYPVYAYNQKLIWVGTHTAFADLRYLWFYHIFAINVL